MVYALMEKQSSGGEYSLFIEFRSNNALWFDIPWPRDAMQLVA